MQRICLAAFAAVLSFSLSIRPVVAQQGMGVGNANPLEMLDVSGAIKIGTDINNSNAAPTGGAGTIRFRAGQFEGWDGASWIPLGGGGGNSPFLVSNNLVQPDNTLVNLATDDFIFGSPSLDDNANTDNDGRFFFDKSKAAFRAGLVTGDQWDDFKRGNQSFAVGYDVTASGDYSMTLGEKSWATATGAIAMGRKAYAEGEHSFASGNDVQATGEGAVALGRLAFSTGNFSYAVGSDVTASAEYSMAVGANSNASQPYAIALGANATATAGSAFALGYNAAASAFEASAIGYNVFATGDQSIGFGHDVTALSNYEVVLGKHNSIYVPLSSTSWQPTDRLFSIGNGIDGANRSNALTILKNGNTGIGTDTPSATLHVDGSLRYVDGNQQAGFIPVSTANGTMVWTDPATIATAADGDGNSTNELQTLSQSGTDVTLSNGGGTISVADNDNDASNEIQSLTLTGNTLAISGSNNVDLSGYVSSDDQNLTGATLTGTTLQIDIEGGSSTSVDLASLVDDGDWTTSGTNIHNANTGNVGVGTASPSEKFHVVNSSDDAIIRVESPSSGYEARVEFWKFGSFNSAVGYYPGNANLRVRTNTNNAILFEPNAVEAMRVQPNGNVGIGATSPSEKLHVAGSIRMVDGNQAAGYIPVSDANGKMTWTDPTTVAAADDGDWTINGTNIYNANTGNVGVGTASPSEKFHVVNSSDDAIIRVESPSSGYEARVEFWKFGSFNSAVGYYPGNANLRVRTNTNNAILFEPNAVEAMRVQPNGNVGIGATSPSEKLHVAGSIRMVDGNQAAGYIPVSDANGKMTWTDPTTVAAADDGDWTINGTDIYNANTGNVGVGTASPSEKLHVVNSSDDAIVRVESPSSGYEARVEFWKFGSLNSAVGYYPGNANLRVRTNTNNAILFEPNAVEAMRVQPNGNVGIGTSSPDATMQVVGNSIIGADAQTNTGTNSLVVGEANANSGIRNLVTGNANNVTANHVLVAGNGHTVAGNYSVVLNNGNSNTAAATTSIVGGFQSSVTENLGLAIGWGNTASAVVAGAFGRGNEAHSFGEFVVGTFNTDYTPISTSGINGSDRVFTVGNGTSTAARSDAMVILKNGNTGIGVSNPLDKLHLEGSIRMVDGNQQVGYIPVSDANGKMTWTNPVTITTAADGDGSSTNELQSLTLTGNTLAISGGNNVDLSGYVSSDDQNLTGATLTGTTLQIDIEGGSSTSVNLASLVDDGDWTSSGTNIYNANTGNVGIGTPSPNYKVSINDGTSTWLQLTSTASGSTATDGMMIGLTGSNEGRITVRENWPLLFYTNNTQQMRIEADGNVGIGTTATSAKLQVTPTTGVAIMVDRTTGNPNIEAGPTAGGWFIADGNMASNGKAGLNYYSAGDVVLAQGGGNVGVGVAAPLDELHVEGSIRMVDGNQANGYVATSDANGTIAWENPRRGVNFVEQVGTTGIGDNSWVDLAANTARTIDVRNGDIISVWADANIRFQSGSGADDFEYRVSYSGCATGNMQTKTMRFDEAGGHDNFTPLTYADAMVVSCNGTLTFKYSVRRSSGDDPWEATNGVVIFRKN